MSHVKKNSQADPVDLLNLVKPGELAAQLNRGPVEENPVTLTAVYSWAHRGSVPAYRRASVVEAIHAILKQKLDLVQSYR